MSPDMKKCKKCGANYTSNRCNPCRNIYLRERYSKRISIEAEIRKAWVENNHEKKLAYQKKYRDKNSEVLIKKSIECHKKNPERGRVAVRKYYEKNKEKINATNKIWKEKNKDHVLEYARNYAKLNPEVKIRSENKRRAKISGAGGSISKGITDKLSKLQKSRCACCKLPLGDDYHLDHIMPIALGGTNTDDNIQLLHAKCNMKKHAKHPIDFMQSKGFLL